MCQGLGILKTHTEPTIACECSVENNVAEAATIEVMSAHLHAASGAYANTEQALERLQSAGVRATLEAVYS